MPHPFIRRRLLQTIAHGISHARSEWRWSFIVQTVVSGTRIPMVTILALRETASTSRVSLWAKLLVVQNVGWANWRREQPLRNRSTRSIASSDVRYCDPAEG